MFSFKSFLHEGKHDPAIFKVIFMAGGPGSGKSFIAKSLGLRALGFVEINSDKAFEMGLKKSLLDIKMPDSEEYPRDIVRGLAKKTTKSKVNEAGNYTKPTMRKNLFNRIKAGGKGGKPGQWSGRKAQMLAKQYKAKGGGYK